MKDCKDQEFKKKGKKKTYSKKKDTSKPKSVSDKRDEYYDSSNDASWYIKNEQLLRDAASIPFSNMQGVPFTVSYSNKWGGGSSNVNVGTIAAHYLYPTFGNPQNWNDPMNVAATNLYSFVRHANSGSKNYDKANLMIYIMAVGQLYQFIEWCKRLYGIVGLASVYNRAIPAGLIRSNGVNFLSLSSNLSPFRSWLNRFILRCSIFGVPSKLSFFDRMQFLYSNLYADATNVRMQIHEYVPFAFFKYVEPGTGDPSTVGTLVPVSAGHAYDAATELFNDGTASTSLTAAGMNGTQPLLNQDSAYKLSVDDVIAIGESLLAPIASSEDFGIISGDILKAFGAEGMKQLTTIPEDYTVVPVYNLEVLHQIHNIRHMFPRAASSNTFYKLNTMFGMLYEVTSGSEAGALRMNNVMAGAGNGVLAGASNLSGTILDYDLDNVSPADVVVSTRLLATTKQGTASGTPLIYPVLLDSCGSEICLYTTYYGGNGSAAYVADNLGTDQTPAANLSHHFRLAPMTFILDANGNIATTGIDSEVQNYTVVGFDVIERLTAMANLGLYDVPTIGGWNVKG